MSQFISPVATNNTSNNSPNLRDESFLEMKNFLYSLEKNLRDKELTITNLKNEISNQEKNKISLNQELEKRDNLIKELSFSLENLKNQVKQYQNRINELEVENRQLNYSNIELNQRNKSLLSSKTSLNKGNDIYEISNKLDEIEITKTKLEFDNVKLVNRINEIESEYNNEINLLTKIKDNEIVQLQKTILSLEKQLKSNINQNNLNEQNQNSFDNNNNNQFSSKFIIEQISSFEKKIKKLNDEIFNLQKENKNMENKLKENKIEIEHKDKFIQQLRLKVDDSEALFHQKINELKINHNDYLIEAKESQNEIEKLIYEKDKLMKENNQLKSNFQKFNIGLKETNDLFEEKTKSFNNVINTYNNKLKEYRNKVQQLKIKINELHNEKQELLKKISNLNEDKEKLLKKQIKRNNNKSVQLNSNRFFNNIPNNYNELNSNFLSLTPKNEQYKILNNDINSFRSNQVMINNNLINNVNDPFYQSQYKSLNEFKKVLTKVDENLKQDYTKLTEEEL